MKTYLKTLERMFKRHVTRLISIILMVLVSIGFTSGIGTSTDKIAVSLSDYYHAQNVSDLIVMNATEEDAALLETRYGQERVMRGAVLELTVQDGRAELSDSASVTFTGVRDGVTRIYFFDGMTDEDAFTAQNKLTLQTEPDGTGGEDGEVTVYMERETAQLRAAEATEFSAEIALSVAGMPAPVTITRNFRLGGTVLNPLHMAARDDVSFTEAEDGELLLLDAIYYVFDEALFAQVTGAGIPLSLYLTLPDRDDQLLFLGGYDRYVEGEAEAIAAGGLSQDAEILTLHENFSFESFREFGNKILGIGILLMVVFLFVTVLVVLSTMTRLLEEERGQIACLMTVGYSPARIIFKYLLFALIGTIIGGAGAVFAGIGLARIIYINFSWNYALPPYSMRITPVFFLATFLVVLCATLFATWLAGRQMTREKPATLLRPKAPKTGKKTFLERIPLLWNRLSFKYKSTVRNVFRFKTRFFMTVIAVAFSTALVLAGLAVLDCCLFQDVGTTAMIAVAVIVVIFAALLNIVVIYTLTNINISERERELATLMVLGYQDKEVAGYIYREIYITGTIGILFGIPLSSLLCLFIFYVMGFGSVAGINWFVWVLAPVLSLLFTFLVTLMLRRKIVKIDMNQSLKAIE